MFVRLSATSVLLSQLHARLPWLRNAPRGAASVMLSAMQQQQLATSTTTGGIDESNPFGLKWHRSMIRSKDPVASVKYYQERFGLTLVDVYHLPALGRSNYFLASLREGENRDLPEPGTREAHERLFDMEQSCVELQHEHDDGSSDVRYCNGNDEPYRGFGHLAFLTDDVYKASENLEKAGVGFKKRPDEGRMKGLAFAYDPDGYYIELVPRDKEANYPEQYNLGQTMLRVKDVKKALDFYVGEDGLGMTKICELHFDDFSLYFLQSLTPRERETLPPPDSPLAYAWMKRSWAPVLELTHNHGTEKDTQFKYHDSNTEPKGFGFLGFIVDDVDGASKSLLSKGAEEVPEPSIFQGKLRRFRDPDGYHVQLAKRKAVLE